MFIFLILLLVAALASPAKLDSMSVNETKANIISTRIIGGLPATMVKIPYIVSITANGLHMCGGSILSKRTIITAAHCLTFWSPRDLKVHAGARTHNTSEGQLVDVIATHSHRLYNSKNMDYDLGFLRLAKPLIYSATVKPIRLAQRNEIRGNLAIVAGWGYLKADGVESEKLNFAQVPIVDRRTCNYLMRGMLTNRMICAGYLKGGLDACQKDSGRPLAAKNKLIGVVSWGDGCALPKKPGVYTHVALLELWISEYMVKKYNETI